jgi:hypothetical protein
MKTILIFSILFFISSSWAWKSNAVTFGPSNGKLQYTPDAEGHIIPDFSHAGFASGEKDLPILSPTTIVSGPSGGNDQPIIQRILDSLGRLSPNSEGFRGVLLLRAGRYRMDAPLEIKYSGVVLQGEGQKSDGTILDFGSNLLGIQIGGGDDDPNWKRRTGSIANITADIIPIGSYSIPVDDVSIFNIGDRVIINHRSTEAWLQAIDYGGVTVSSKQWSPGMADITYNRVIDSIAENTLFLDAPVFNVLDRSLSQSTVQKYNSSGFTQLNGLENLRLEFEKNNTIENYGVVFLQSSESWASKVSIMDVTRDGFQTNTAHHITIDSTEVRGFSQVENGGWAYLYNLNESSQLILIKNSKAWEGRHNFISNGKSSVSGCVFYNVESGKALYNSEGHRLWTHGLLFDNFKHKADQPGRNRPLALMNRNDAGSGHGWATVNSVVWNSDMGVEGDLWIQKAPTAQNWSIGTKAREVLNKGFGPGADAWVEVPDNSDPEIPSLYLAQLNDRMVQLPELPVVTNQKNVFPNQSLLNTTLQIGKRLIPVPSQGSYRVQYRSLNGRLLRSDYLYAPGSYPDPNADVQQALTLQLHKISD